MEIKPRRANKRSTRRASRRQPIPATTALESRTATGFMAAQFFFDLTHRGENLFYRLRTCRAIFVQLVEFGGQGHPFLFLLAPDQLADHVARGRKTALLFACLYPGKLAWREGDVQRLSHAPNVNGNGKVGKIQHAHTCPLCPLLAPLHNTSRSCFT